MLMSWTAQPRPAQRPRRSTSRSVRSSTSSNTRSGTRRPKKRGDSRVRAASWAVNVEHRTGRHAMSPDPTAVGRRLAEPVGQR